MSGLDKLHRRGYLISPFSRWEKGRERGAKLGRLDTEALSPTLSQRERESGQAKSDGQNPKRVSD
jgi:hypothetical protein